jgi:thermostable 8-oxoguanine DNA glycosylase
MMVTNLERMNDDLWNQTRHVLETVRIERTQLTEKEAAEFIGREYKGFGPKQSRNLLQWLGLTRFEIPLDSRLIKWLNEFGFPVELSAKGLADRHYYNFVSEGVQALCEKSGVFPCILDAAVFSSFDRELDTCSID